MRGQRGILATGTSGLMKQFRDLTEKRVYEAGHHDGATVGFLVGFCGAMVLSVLVLLMR